MGDAVASWLVRSISLDGSIANGSVRVRGLLCSWTRQCTFIVLSLLKCINGIRRTCDGLGFHPRGVGLLLVASCYRNRDYQPPDEPLSFTFYLPLSWELQVLERQPTKYNFNCIYAKTFKACPVIDHEFRHNIVKVAVDPRGDSRE